MAINANDQFYILKLARKLKSRKLTDEQIVDEVHAQFNPHDRDEIEILLRSKGIIQ